MFHKNGIRLYLITSLMCLSTEYIYGASQSQDGTNTFLSNIDGIASINLKLTPHDSTMKDLLLTHDQKNAVLKNIDKVLSEKNKVIFEYMKLTKSLNSKVNELSLTQRLKGEFKKRELSNSIEGQEDLIADLKGQIEEKTLRIGFLKKMVKNQNTQLTEKINKLNYKIKNLTNSFNELPEEMEKMAFLSESQHVQEIRTLQNQLHQKSIRIISYQDQLVKYKDLNDISKRNQQLAIQLEDSNEQLKKYQVSFNRMEERLALEKIKNKKLSEFNKNMKEEYSQHINLLKEKYVAALKRKDSTSNASRMPASVIESKETISKSNLGYLIEIDPSHLKLILDEKFFFTSGQTNLDQNSRIKLQSIMSAYSKEIFTNEELRDRVQNIHVIGHSSPRYKGQPLKPIEATKEAYQANMEVSLHRAKSIVKAIISENLELPYKNEIRSKLVVSGKSFSEPIPLGRNLASNQDGRCGDYDCEASQRVEVIFELQKKE
ncbi:hypothetical protein [Halobacteriovorax sp.]|uniref:hypothetical protein n=1 Tax=Halobacteriovorax sp. TaxID=2020862 RepID=UPI00356445D1